MARYLVTFVIYKSDVFGVPLLFYMLKYSHELFLRAISVPLVGSVCLCVCLMIAVIINFNPDRFASDVTCAKYKWRSKYHVYAFKIINQVKMR